MRKGQRRLDGIDMLVISLDARGMTGRGIQAHLEEIYEVDVSRGLISRITGGELDEVKEWQARPLDPGRCSRSCSSTPSCKVRDRKSAKNQVHVDLATDDREREIAP